MSKPAIAYGLLLASSLAMAQPADDAIYRVLGGKDGIQKIVDDLLTLELADPRIRDNFDGFDLSQIKQRLQEQFCEVSGGPCRYTGKYHDKAMEGVGPVRDMKSTHQDLQITDAMFNALVEDLTQSLDKHSVGAKEKTELLTALGSMKGDIVGQ